MSDSGSSSGLCGASARQRLVTRSVTTTLSRSDWQPQLVQLLVHVSHWISIIYRWPG